MVLEAVAERRHDEPGGLSSRSAQPPSCSRVKHEHLVDAAGRRLHVDRAEVADRHRVVPVERGVEVGHDPHEPLRRRGRRSRAPAASPPRCRGRTGTGGSGRSRPAGARREVGRAGRPVGGDGDPATGERVEAQLAHGRRSAYVRRSVPQRDHVSRAVGVERVAAPSPPNGARGRGRRRRRSRRAGPACDKRTDHGRRRPAGRRRARRAGRWPAAASTSVCTTAAHLVGGDRADGDAVAGVVGGSGTNASTHEPAAGDQPRRRTAPKHACWASGAVRLKKRVVRRGERRGRTGRVGACVGHVADRDRRCGRRRAWPRRRSSMAADASMP